MDQRVLLIEDLITLLRVSRPTLDRWVREARAGKGDFPMPFSEPQRRMLWDANAVEQWIANRNQATRTTLSNVSPAKQMKRESKNFMDRQEAARQTLALHAANRNGQHNIQQKGGLYHDN